MEQLEILLLLQHPIGQQHIGNGDSKINTTFAAVPRRPVGR